MYIVDYHIRHTSRTFKFQYGSQRMQLNRTIQFQISYKCALVWSVFKLIISYLISALDEDKRRDLALVSRLVSRPQHYNSA